MVVDSVPQKAIEQTPVDTAMRVSSDDLDLADEAGEGDENTEKNGYICDTNLESSTVRRAHCAAPHSFMTRATKSQSEPPEQIDALVSEGTDRVDTNADDRCSRSSSKELGPAL